jgi:hypothetical protein
MPPTALITKKEYKQHSTLLSTYKQHNTLLINAVLVDGLGVNIGLNMLDVHPPTVVEGLATAPPVNQAACTDISC